MKFSLVLLTLFCGQILANDRTDTERLLDRTLVSLHKLLEYLDTNKQQINLDAVIGTRIVDGTLQVLSHHLTEHPKLLNDRYYSGIIRRIQNAQRLADDLSNDAIVYIKKDTPSYFQEIGPIIAPGFWQLDVSSRNLDLSKLAPHHLTMENLKENESDACLAELIGTRTKKCDISEECWVMMTSPGYTGYSLTHELLYLQVGIMAGCGEKLEEFAARYGMKSTENMVEYFCANILREYYKIAREDFPPTDEDLFMEQASLCGLSGYRQFFVSEFLERILSWQHGTGCYGFSNKDDDDLETLLVKSEDSAKHGTRMMKRYEKPLSQDCLSHRSAVAAGALAQYIRYAVEYLLATDPNFTGKL